MSKKIEKEKENIIEKLRAVICDKGQMQLFGQEVHYDSFEFLFKQFLEKSGYIVKYVGKIPDVIEKESDLVTYFYKTLDHYKPNLIRESEAKTRGRDFRLAKSLIENRMQALECSREAALRICTKMVEYLIKYERYYNLTYPVTGFNVFNKASIDWIFNRTEMIKKNPGVFSVDSRFEVDEEEFTEKMIQEYGIEHVGFDLKEDK